MTHGSLFSGIGGFDLAAEWMKWENVFHCEKDSFCQKVLKKNFNNCILHEDIKTTDFSRYNGSIDILSGGFPCQPFSASGRRKGTEDDRYLWPEMLRAIREISPRWIVGENVLGLVNWSRGLVFEQVQTDLEAAGYEVIPFLLPAAGVNAPHIRYRIWFVAHAREVRYEDHNYINEGIIPQTQIKNQGSWTPRDYTPQYWSGFPHEPHIRGGNDGLPFELDRIGALGNAIVPQIAYKIFQAIAAYELIYSATLPTKVC